MTASNTFLAPAKINLFLHITGVRDDGYHLLQTAFQLLDFHDTLTINPTQDGKITRINNIEGVDEADDLCVKAAKALQQATDCALGATIEIEKRIPMGGGLGGGSSDAATVLLALNKLWSLHLDQQTLIDIGVKLGADVPFFIFGQTAWAEGIGEQLTALNDKITDNESYYVVLTPDVHVSTAKIFSHSGLTKDTKPLKIADFSNAAYFDAFKNDLEKVVCNEFPAVAAAFDWLNQFGKARMSGSGASVFVQLNSKQQAEEILQQKPKNCFGFVAKGLKYHPHFNLSAK